jgi:hypothetical protein
MGLEKYAGRLPSVLFALALIDACIIGASAVSLSKAYAIGDVLSLRHSRHRKPNQAKGFLRALLWTHPDGRGARPDPGHASRPADERGPDLGRGLAPERHRIPAAVCNDQAVLGP